MEVEMEGVKMLLKLLLTDDRKKQSIKYMIKNIVVIQLLRGFKVKAGVPKGYGEYY